MASQRVTYIGRTALLSPIADSTQRNYNSMLEGVTAIGKRIEQTPTIETLSRMESYMVDSLSQVIPDTLTGKIYIIISTTKGEITQITHRDPNAFEGFKTYITQRYAHLIGDVDFRIVSNACISGVAAIIAADRYIRGGFCDHAIIIGIDLISDFITSGFKAFKSVSDTPCVPYDAQRCGLSLGEACGAILLTSQRDLSCGYAVLGGAMTNDANHISGPSRTGLPLATAISQALDEASLTRDDLAFINAHGTGTVYNDEMESKALAHAQLSDIPLNSLKPYFGHTLGASGVIETIISLEELQSQTLLGTKGFQTLGTPHPVNVSAEHRHIQGKAFLKTASGFGGCNAALVIGEEHTSLNNAYQKAPYIKLKTSSCLRVKDNNVTYEDKVIFASEGDFATFIRAAYKDLNLDYPKFFKMSDLCKLGYVGTEYLLHHLPLSEQSAPTRVAIVMYNEWSSYDTDIQHHTMLAEGQLVSPSVFVYTLPNIIIGELSIRHKIEGEGLFFITKHESQAMEYARLLLCRENYDVVLLAFCEKRGDEYDFKMKQIRVETE